MSNGVDFKDESYIHQRPIAIKMGLAKYNLSLPDGTTMNTAFQQLSSPDEIGDNVTSTQAMVETQSSSLDCERAEIHVRWNFGNAEGLATVRAPATVRATQIFGQHSKSSQ